MTNSIKTISSKQELDNLLSSLFSNNNFLVLPDAMHNNDTVKNMLAMFSDGRLVVSEKHKFNGAVLSMQVLIKKATNQDATKILVPSDFIKTIYQTATQENTTAYELFKSGDHTTSNIELPCYKKDTQKLLMTKKLISQTLIQSFSADLVEEWRDIEFELIRLKKEAKSLSFPNAKISLDITDIAVFDDGSLYHAQYMPAPMLQDIKQKLAKKDINITELAPVPYRFIAELYAQARGLYVKELKQTEVEKQPTFLEKLFANNNQLIDVDEAYEAIKHKFAVFTDGRFIVSKDTIRAEEGAINSIIRSFAKKDIFFFAKEYVPASYLNEIYKTKKTTTANKEETHAMPNAIVEDLFSNNNKCVSLADTLLEVKDRDKIAMFSDGTIVVAKSHIKSFEVASYLHFKLGYNSPQINAKLKEATVVKDDVMASIYKKAHELQKGFKDIVLEKIKKQAKVLSKEREISHTQALEILAKNYGFNNYHQLSKIEEGYAHYLLRQIKQDEGFQL